MSSDLDPKNERRGWVKHERLQLYGYKLIDLFSVINKKPVSSRKLARVYSVLLHLSTNHEFNCKSLSRRELSFYTDCTEKEYRACLNWLGKFKLIEKQEDIDGEVPDVVRIWIKRPDDVIQELREAFIQHDDIFEIVKSHASREEKLKRISLIIDSPEFWESRKKGSIKEFIENSESLLLKSKKSRPYLPEFVLDSGLVVLNFDVFEKRTNYPDRKKSNAA